MIMSLTSHSTTSQSLQHCIMPTGLGLLTTVAQLPTKYKIRYLARATLVETPLDLTVKQQCTFIANANNHDFIYQSTDLIRSQQDKHQNGPITPPPSPPKKRYREEGYYSSDSEIIPPPTILSNKYSESSSHSSPLLVPEEKTPSKPIKTISAPRTGKSHPHIQRDKKTKVTRKLKFDEDTSSPVSGTIIRPLEEINSNLEEHQSGDIDPEFNIVEVTEEAKQELASIKNIIGAYACKLCRLEFDDAFGLARHRCSCIVLLEYRCPECGKRFNCPANLASHRRWHKPKEEVLRKQQENCENDQQYPCLECGKNFKRQAYLRKHLTTHKHREETTKRKVHSSMDGGNKKKIPKIKDEFTNSSNSNSMDDYRYSLPNSSINYNMNQLYKYDSECESRSDCSSPGRLHIVDDNNLTEEENIAAAALAHLRNGPSVIQHTTATIAY